MGRTRKLSNNGAIQSRPNANKGLWVGFLLPLCVLASIVRHPIESSKIYQLAAVLTLGILYTTTIFVIRYRSTKCTILPFRSFILPFIAITFIYLLHFDKGAIFSIFAALLSTYGYYRLYIFVIRRFAMCFTLGEAMACTQAFTMFLFGAAVNISECLIKPPRTTGQISTLTLQVGLLTVLFIVTLLYRYPKLRISNNFFIMLGITLVSFMIVPLQIMIGKNPLLWIFELLTGDILQIKIFFYWSFCTALAVVILTKQIRGAKKASNVIRKTFHILAVMIFVPGMLYECSILYLASGVALGIFIGIETMRLINLPQVAPFLEDGFSVFRDEKDIGSIALTPMYLLVGISFPLWVHPAPCDMTNSVGFNLLPLLSGILTIGVGDSAASYMGAYFGKHTWKGTAKTIEGTIGCILSQAAFVFVLVYLGYVDDQLMTLARVGLAIFVTSIVEAKTTQVDNLVLPMVMYLMLI